MYKRQAEVGAHGRASVTITASSAGTTEVGAVYGGDAGHDGSSAALVLQVGSAATTTTLASSANPAGAGQPVTLTVQVGCPAAATGTVTFLDGGQALGTAPVAGGQAALTVTLKSGRHRVTAAYGGDAACAASTSSSLLQTVRGAPAAAPAPAPALQATTTTLTSSANPAGAGQPVTFTAQVGCATPATGTVTFTDGRQVLGTAQVVNGQASLSVTLAGGRHRVTAAYGGDAGCAASTSAPLMQTVSRK